MKKKGSGVFVDSRAPVAGEAPHAQASWRLRGDRWSCAEGSAVPWATVWLSPMPSSELLTSTTIAFGS